MANRRKKEKQRDAELTKKRILESASQLVIEQGFAGLTATNIARRIGKDRTIVSYHFGNLANFQRIYIREKDYWPRFFERFTLPEKPGSFDVRQLFSELMKENLRFFRSNPEMQKIILWQISNKNPLMRRISDEREIEGGKLLAMADPFFRDSGISFKAVEALLLGGIYYIVMHAENNKSTVCGIDINIERDRDIVLNTIGQIIDWAWEAAQSNIDIKKMNKPMNLEFELLETIVDEIVTRRGSVPLAGRPDKALQIEARRIQETVAEHLLALENPTQVATYLNMALLRLVRICDKLLHKDNLVDENAMLLLDLLSAIRTILPQNVSPDLPLPKAFIVMEAPSLFGRWSALKKQLLDKGLDSSLVEIAGLPVLGFNLGKDRLKWSDYTWLRRMLDILENVDWTAHGCASDEEALISRLIRVGYNHQRFLSYCYRVIRNRVDRCVGRKSKLDELSRCRALILQDVSVSDLRYENRAEKVGDTLCLWIDAEIKLIIDTVPEDDPAGFVNPFKFKYRLNVQALALWYKLQYDRGVFDEENLDQLSEKIARNCSAKQQSDISQGSIKTKFYVRETTHVRAVRELIRSMLSDLDNFV